MLNSRKISPTQIQLTPNGLHEILSKSANGVIVQVISSEVINTQNGIKYKYVYIKQCLDDFYIEL